MDRHHPLERAAVALDLVIRLLEHPVPDDGVADGIRVEERSDRLSVPCDVRARGTDDGPCREKPYIVAERISSATVRAARPGSFAS